MLKHHFILSHTTLSSLQVQSEPEIIHLPLYSLKHEQVQSLQEDEHPCQTQQEPLSLRCYCHATVTYPGLQHALMGSMVSWWILAHLPLDFVYLTLMKKLGQQSPIKYTFSMPLIQTHILFHQLIQETTDLACSLTFTKTLIIYCGMVKIRIGAIKW